MKASCVATILAGLVVAGLSGCAPSYTFSPYVGQQQNWTTGPGSYVKIVDGATLYAPNQYPNRPYIIVGAVTADSEAHLAKAVHEHHADAALVSNQSNMLTANLIKFKS